MAQVCGYVLTALALFVLGPAFVYLIVKMGTAGYYRGRRLGRGDTGVKVWQVPEEEGYDGRTRR